MSLAQDGLLIKEYVEKMILYLKKDSIKTLKKENHQEFFNKTSNKFSQIKEKIPSLFNHIIDLDDPDEFEMFRLEEMLLLRQRTKNNTVGRERAHIDTGKKYFKEFVEPKVDMSKEPSHPTRRK